MPGVVPGGFASIKGDRQEREEKPEDRYADKTEACCYACAVENVAEVGAGDASSAIALNQVFRRW